MSDCRSEEKRGERGERRGALKREELSEKNAWFKRECDALAHYTQLEFAWLAGTTIVTKRRWLTSSVVQFRFAAQNSIQITF